MRFHFPVIIIDEDFRSENASGLGIRALAEALEKEGLEVLGVTSYGDLTSFAQQQSRASAFILSLDDEELFMEPEETLTDWTPGTRARWRLKPAMLATMDLKEHTERKMLVPNSAVVREGNDEYIFIQRGQAFVMRKASLGAEYGGRRVVMDGINPGDKVVLDGAFHLNTERRMRTLRSGEGS